MAVLRFQEDGNGDAHAPGLPTDRFQLTTVGIDVGSATTQIVFSNLVLERMGQQLSSRFVVSQRDTIYESEVYFTPYATGYRIDDAELRARFDQAFAAAGLTPAMIDTGAILLTGEAVKRENAEAITALFAKEAGKYVSATAGPHLEAILGAHGSGAVELSRAAQMTVLSVDIGGGTTKFARIENGSIAHTQSIDVGGRLLAVDNQRRVIRVEPSAARYASRLGIEVELGALLQPDDRARIAAAMAADVVRTIRALKPHEFVSYSGGVSEFIYGYSDHDFGDLGLFLGRSIATEMGAVDAQAAGARPPIRATVLGLSQFAVQASGNTLFVTRPSALPIRNLCVLPIEIGDDARAADVATLLADARKKASAAAGISVPQYAIAVAFSGPPRHKDLREIAKGVWEGIRDQGQSAVVLVFERDIGRLVASILKFELGCEADIVSIDGIAGLTEFDRIDVGQLVDPPGVIPVIVKSLVFPFTMQEDWGG